MRVNHMNIRLKTGIDSLPGCLENMSERRTACERILDRRERDGDGLYHGDAEASAFASLCACSVVNLGINQEGNTPGSPRLAG